MKTLRRVGARVLDDGPFWMLIIAAVWHAALAIASATSLVTGWRDA